MDQQVKNIAISDLVLWTENPRDPIDKNSTDQDIVNRALDGAQSIWKLSELAAQMGERYDLSELPTVVYHDDKPVVYDGNRRMILGKIKHGLVSVPAAVNLSLPNFPTDIPCNVCTREVALDNVLRKHADSGSWRPLERDIFLHKFMKESKTTFLILEDETGIISTNPFLNQRFVKEEIFTPTILESLGFSIQNDRIISPHSANEAHAILSDIANKIADKIITTRKNRGKVIDVLEPSTRKLIDANKDKKQKPLRLSFTPHKSNSNKRRTRRTTKANDNFFGGPLYLQAGTVSDIYRDIADLYNYYINNKKTLSNTFPCLIRMALRLLCETAAGSSKEIEPFLKKHYADAKKILTQDQMTTLSSNTVSESNITQLLHTGAHNYESSKNINQTIAMSIIIGAILTLTHGKN